MLRLPLEEELKPPKAIKARKYGPVHRGGVDHKVVSKTKPNLKPVLSQYHGPIHREVAHSEVVKHEVIGELSEQETSEVVSDHHPSETYSYSRNQSKLHLVQGESPHQLKPAPRHQNHHPEPTPPNSLPRFTPTKLLLLKT